MRVHKHRARNRRGVIMLVELLFVLPIPLMVTLVIVQFYMVVTASDQMRLASEQGARVAAASEVHSPEDRAAAEDDVKKMVKRGLGHGRLSQANVEVTWSNYLPPEKAKLVVGEPDWVQVTVSIKTRRVVPDVLGWVGFAIGGQDLTAVTTMKQE